MAGDVIGDSGMRVIVEGLPVIIAREKPDLVVVNGENARQGFGITAAQVRMLRQAGADVVTSGNHVWESPDAGQLLDEEERLLRPLNYPPGASGCGWILLETRISGNPATCLARGNLASGCGTPPPRTLEGCPDGSVPSSLQSSQDVPEGQAVRWLVINAQGREGMTALDCPFRSVASFLESMKPFSLEGCPVVSVLDFHAESPQEKEALAFHLDGRLSVLAGTHTHVQTADEKILPKGLGYISDLGMTGPGDSVIGVDADICVRRFVSRIPLKMFIAESQSTIHGALFEIDSATGRCTAVRRIAEPWQEAGTPCAVQPPG